MPGPNIFAGFGIRRAWIATPVAVPVWIEIPAIISAAFKATVTEVEQTGNDAILDQWYTGQKGSITVKASRAAMNIFAQLSGVTNTSTASFNQLSFGLSTELTPPIVAIRGLVVGKDDTLAKIHMIIYWYRCHVKTVFEAFPESTYGKLSEATLSFIAIRSGFDETNAVLPTAANAIGRLEVWIASLSPLSGQE